jgi:Copper transport outer membrane protein, MctB
LISFRYHIFTIVAIFLAVGIGLLFGTSVVQPALIRDLRRQTQQLTSDLKDTRAEVSRLQGEVANLQASGDILSSLDPGTLADYPVIILTHEGVDPHLLSQTRQALAEARVKLVAVLAITDHLALRDQRDRAALAQILGMSPSADPADLQQRLAQDLADRLATGPPRKGVSSQPDVLDRLLTQNFLTTTPGSPTISRSDLPRLGGQGQVVIALSGGQGQPAVEPQDFFVPFVVTLVKRGASVAAGESADTAYPFVPVLRSSGGAGDGERMVTVDDLDFTVGGAALVLGLERLLLLGQGGNYGIKAGATSPLPSPPP